MPEEQFDSGLDPDLFVELNNVLSDLSISIYKIEELGRHRNYSLAITKIEEARHWLDDRKRKKA